MFPSGRLYSQAFHLGSQRFFLSAYCNMDQQSSFHCFGLFLGMQEKDSVSFSVDYEFAARSRQTEEFVRKYKNNYTLIGGKAVGYKNFFATPWTSFMVEDSLYFINGVLHLRVELTCRNRHDYNSKFCLVVDSCLFCSTFSYFPLTLCRIYDLCFDFFLVKINLILDFVMKT